MNEFETYLRKFQLDELIFLFSEISRDMYNKNEYLRQIPAYAIYGNLLLLASTFGEISANNFPEIFPSPL